MIKALRELLGQLGGQAKNNPAVARNFGALTIIQFTTLAMPLITGSYVIRTIGLERFGILEFAAAFNAYLIILTDYGFRISAPRAIAIHRGDGRKVSEVFTSVLFIKLGLMTASFLILCFAMWINQALRADWAVQLFTFGMVIANVVSINWFFQGVERMEFLTALNLGSKFLYVALLFTFVRTADHFVRIPILTSVTEILTGLTGLVIAMRRFKLRFVRFSAETLRLQWIEGWHTFLSTISINAYTQSPRFALGEFHGKTVVGYYGVAQRMASVFQTVPLASLLQAVYPRLSHVYATKKAESYRLMKLAQRATTILYILGLPVLFLATPIAVRLFAGKFLPETITAFKVLAIGVVIMNANAFRLQFLLVSGRHHIYSRIHVVVGIIGTALVFAGAKYGSYLGPPVALIAIDLAVLIWTWIVVRREMTAEGL